MFSGSVVVTLVLCHSTRFARGLPPPWRCPAWSLRPSTRWLGHSQWAEYRGLKKRCGFYRRSRLRVPKRLRTAEREKPLTRSNHMKVFSAIWKEGDDWGFDYWANADPSSELHNAGAILVEREIGDIKLGSGLRNARYSGSAYTAANSEVALKTVQERLAR